MISGLRMPACSAGYRVRPAIPDDARLLAPRLRTDDRREIEAVTGEHPHEAILRSIISSDPCYAVVDDQTAPIGAFGTTADRGDIGIVWCLGSDALVQRPLLFLRHSLSWIAHLHDRHNTLWNVVDARNQAHLRWLAWCGFSIIDVYQEYGVQKRPFYKVGRLRNWDSPAARWAARPEVLVVP